MSARAATGFTEMSVRGYKSIADEARLAIRPLTLLAGANSSGKSSIVQPLLLLKQTLDAIFDPGPLLLHGPNVKITSVDQVLSRTRTGPTSDSFAVSLQWNGEDVITELFGQSQRRGIEIREMLLRSAPGISPYLTLRPGMRHETIDSQIPEDANFIKHGFESFRNARWVVDRRRCFLSVAIHSAGEDGQSSSDDDRVFSLSSFFPQRVNDFEQGLRRIIHVPALRGNPERTYQTTAIESEFPGTFDDYVASVISNWKADKDDRLKELGNYLETLGLTWKVDARSVDDTQVELRVGRLPHAQRGGAQDLVNIADVGAGVAQTLPVLVALLAAQPGQLVYLEEPEIHLHPRAQVHLAELLARAAKNGTRIVVETHSSLLLLSLQTMIAAGDLNADDVALHWFQRSNDGFTSVFTAELDAQGRFGEWPEDFDRVALEAEDKYLRAVEEKVLRS